MLQQGKLRWLYLLFAALAASETLLLQYLALDLVRMLTPLLWPMSPYPLPLLRLMGGNIINWICLCPSYLCFCCWIRIDLINLVISSILTS